MAVSSVFPSRPSLVMCACLLLAPVARAAVSVPEAPAVAPSAPVVPPSPPPAGAQAPAPLAAPAAPAEERLGAATSPALSGAEPEEQSESLGWMLTRTLLVFGGVVAFIYLTLNIGLRKLMGIQGVGVGRPTVVSVVERLTLDQRRTLFVLKAADEYLLVGGGENGLQMLSKLDTQAVERIRAVSPAAPPLAMSPFLKKLLARRAAPPPGVTQPSGAPPPGA